MDFAAEDTSSSLGLESKVVRLVAYDSRWPELFLSEAARLTRAVAAAGLEPLRFEHVGSTSVPGLAAKPVLDVAAGRIATVSSTDYVPVMEEAGYIHRGEAGLPGRDFFRRGQLRTHHVHLVEIGGENWRRYLIFRDALRADNQARRAYESLKQALAARYPRDREAYLEGKSAFVEELIGRSTAGGGGAILSSG